MIRDNEKAATRRYGIDYLVRLNAAAEVMADVKRIMEMPLVEENTDFYLKITTNSLEFFEGKSLSILFRHIDGEPVCAWLNECSE